MAKYKRKQTEKVSLANTILLYIHDLAYLIAIMMIAFLFLFRVVVVSGASMNDTLLDGDYVLLLSNVFYTEPQQGDVVVASKDSFENGVPIVKRVIATEGQTVDIDFVNSVVYVDGVALDEPYVSSPTQMPEGVKFPLTVGANCVFLLGDNRAVSRDSRDPVIGQVDKREILGKAIFLFLPGQEGVSNQRDFSRIGGMP